LYLEQRDIGARVVTYQCGLKAPLIMEGDPNGMGSIYDVVVGEHQAFGVHDDATSGRDSQCVITGSAGRQCVVSGHLLNPGSNQRAALYMDVNGGRQDRLADVRKVGSNRCGRGGCHSDKRTEAEQEKFEAIVHVVKLN
jgi:hypothetical protein